MWTTRLAMLVVLAVAVSCGDESGDEDNTFVPPPPRCAEPSALEMIVAPRYYIPFDSVLDEMVIDGAVYGATTTSLIRFADETYDVLAEIPCAPGRICRRLGYWAAGDGFDILRHDSSVAAVGDYKPGGTLVTLWHVPRAGGDVTASAEWELYPSSSIVREDTRLLMRGSFPGANGLLALPLDGGVPIVLEHDGSVDEYFDGHLTELEKLGPYLLAKVDLPGGDAIYIVEPESGARRHVEVPNVESVRFIGSGDNEAFVAVFIEEKTDAYFDIWRIDTTGAASVLIHDVDSQVGYFAGIFSVEHDDMFNQKNGLETSDIYMYDGSGAELSERDCLSGYDYIDYTVIGVDADYVYFEARDPLWQTSYARLARNR